MNDPIFDAQLAELGVGDKKLNEALRLRAKTQRNLQPTKRSISCAGPGCRNEAVEMWFFCSRRCRDLFLMERGIG